MIISNYCCICFHFLAIVRNLLKVFVKYKAMIFLTHSTLAPNSFKKNLWGGSAAAAAKLLQSCPTLCHPIDGGPPGSHVPGILQARTLEWVAISFSNACKWKVKVKSLSCLRLFATPWTAAYQAPLSMGFSRQEYWSGCHCLLCWGGSLLPNADFPLSQRQWWFSNRKWKEEWGARDSNLAYISSLRAVLGKGVRGEQVTWEHRQMSTSVLWAMCLLSTRGEQRFAAEQLGFCLQNAISLVPCCMEVQSSCHLWTPDLPLSDCEDQTSLRTSLSSTVHFCEMGAITLTLQELSHGEQ